MAGISAPEFVDVLKVALDARADIIALDPRPVVYSYWPSADYSITDAIILGYEGRSGPRTPGELGPNSIDEEPILDSLIRVMRAGAGEDVAKSARDRARAILLIVDNELRTNHPELAGADDWVMWARVGAYDYKQFPDPGAETPMSVYLLEFEILYRARLGP